MPISRDLLRPLGGMVALATVALVSPEAKALAITFSDLPNGTHSAAVVGQWSATSSPRNFKQKTVNGFVGVGVAGGFVDGEIDLDNESISFLFDMPQTLADITIAFLFKNGNFGDVVSEVARLTISASPFVAGDLSVITPTTATWSGAGGGPVTSVSPGNQAHAGVWTILTPFGNTPISSLTLRSLYVGAPAPGDSRNSDFSFVGLNTAVPEPATLGLLGVGLAGLGLGLRRRRRA